MPLDGRPARLLPENDEELDRAIMAGSPFAMPAPQAKAPVRNAMPAGDLLRALMALGLVFALVAGIGVVMMG
jgi:hypothetical protein